MSVNLSLRVAITAGISIATGAAHGWAFGEAQAAACQFGSIALLSSLVFWLRSEQRWAILFICIAGFWLGSDAVGLRWIAGAITTENVLGFALGGIVYSMLSLGLCALTVAALWAAVHVSARLRNDAICCAVYSSAILAAELLQEAFLPSFPWLRIVYAHMDSPFAVLLPFLGIEGVSWIVLFAAFLVGAVGSSMAIPRSSNVPTGVSALLVALTTGVAARVVPALTQDTDALRVAVMQTAARIRKNSRQAFSVAI